MLQTPNKEQQGASGEMSGSVASEDVVASREADKVRGEDAEAEGCVQKVSSFVNDVLSSMFRRLGMFVGRWPWLVILVSLLMTAGLASGIFCCFETESAPENLFVPQGTRSLVDKVDVETYYGSNTRPVILMITAANEGDNVLSKDALLASLDLYENITQYTLPIPDTNTTYAFPDVCFKVSTPFGDICAVTTILQAWNYDRAAIEASSPAEIRQTLEAAFTPDELSVLVGGVEDIDGGAALSAVGQRFIMLLDNNGTAGETTEDDFLAAELWEEELVILTQDEPSVSWKDTLAVYPQTLFSFSEEIGGTIQGDVGILSASYFIIILYVIFVLQQRCDRVNSSISLSLLAVATIGLGILSAFGVSQYLGYKYGNTHSVLPFIVLGLGADGAFILVNAFRSEPKDLSLPLRAAETLAEAGVSLTVSSLTNVIAFAIGSLTVIPDLASFGKYASLSLLFLWWYLNTFYLACIVLNERRVNKNKLDLLCCFKDCRSNTKEVEQKRTRFSLWMENSYAPFLVKSWFRATIIFLAAAFFGVCVYFITTLTVQATSNNFIPSDSYLRKNVDLTGELFGGERTDVQVISKDFDVIADKVELYNLGSLFRQDGFETSPPYIVPTFDYWMEDFVADLTANAEADNFTRYTIDQAEVPVDDALPGSLRYPVSEEAFFRYLRFWLDDSDIQTGGVVYSSDLVFEDETRGALLRARIRMEHTPIGDFDEEGVFQEDAGEIVKAMDKIFELGDSVSFPTYAYSFKYTNDWASFKVVGQELLQNVSLSLVAVLVVITLLIGHIGMSMLVFLSSVLTIVEVLGMTAIIGLAVDTVVVILVVLAIGISVDYSVHIAYGFMNTKGTRVERISTVLGDVGVPVLNGAVSTFLAVVLQSLSKSYVFVVVFYEFLFAVVFAALNGLILLPIILSLIGPDPFKQSSKQL